MFNFFKKYDYAMTQPEAVIAHLTKYGEATTGEIAKIRANGVKICNVNATVYKARRIFAKRGGKIWCFLQQTKNGNYGLYRVDFGTYWTGTLIKLNNQLPKIDFKK